MKIRRLIFGLAAITLLLTGCKKYTVAPVNIAVLWDVEKNSSTAEKKPISEWNGVPSYMQKQSEAFLQGLQTEGIENLVVNDYPQDETVEDIVHQVARIVNEDENLIIVGSTTNEDTMYAANSASYFSEEMLIPFADGNNIIGRNNPMAVMLSPTADNYVNYVSERMLTKDTINNINSVLFQDRPVLDYTIKIGILFEDSTYGHTNSVILGLALMENGMDINYYKAGSDPSIMENMKVAWREDADRMSDLDVIFFVYESAVFPQDVEELEAFWSDYKKVPIMVTMGVPVKQQPVKSIDTGDMIFIVQAMRTDNCPIYMEKGYFEALGYGAGCYLSKVLKNAQEAMPLYGQTIQQGKKDYHTAYFDLYREEIRKQTWNKYEDIPCIGTVELTSGGVNKNLIIELLVRKNDGTYVTVTDNEFFQMLLDQIKADLNLGQ